MRHELVEGSAAPAAVRIALDHLRERGRDVDSAAEAVVAVTAASRFLTRLLIADAEAMDVLADLGSPVAPLDDLARWKRLELLRIAGRDLLGLDSLDEVGRRLAALGADVLRRASADAPGLAVIGMGKLGGRELNYASDIDVLFVGEGNARAVMDRARTCFRVDADLRPEGRDGPLTRSLDSYRAYWDRWAHPWEFQALLKARAVAGDRDLGGAFEREATARVWGKPFGADDLRSLRDLKARAEDHLARRGAASRELKRGPGGIRDIEFAVQLLQLVHGRADEALRSPTTLDALAELGSAGYVAADDAAALADAYRFLRTVEHRLQLVDEQQVHTLPADTPSREHLARVLGYRDTASATALEQLDRDVARHQATVRSIHERLYFRPLLEAFAGSAALPEGAVGERLTAFGFTDARQTRLALEELTHGLTRASRLMQQMLPLLLEWLSESPDPELGLLGLRTLVGSPHRETQVVTTFRESPDAARRLCRLLGTGRLFINGFVHSPQLVANLAEKKGLAIFTSRTVRPLQRFKRDEELRIATRDVLGVDSVEETGASLTALAESVLQEAIDVVEPPVPMAVVAMGRFGGAELSYASDLDVIVAFDATTNADVAAAERAATDLLKFVKGSTPASRLYLLDLDLRPEGKQGPLARSLDAYRAYYERYAQTWERQAHLRARFVAGDAETGRQFMELIDGFVWGSPFTEADEREIRRMKARVERERIPPGEDPRFHLKLGPGSLSDIEWTAQLLQLRGKVRAPGTIDAVGALQSAGALDPEDAGLLTDAYRFCERTRNRWFLVKGASSDALPTAPDELGKLARSLGTTGSELRDQYRRVTRRARAVVERVFYATGTG